MVVPGLGFLPQAPSMENGSETRIAAARTTVKVAVGLVLVKGATFLLTGSSGVLGSALDSLLDVLASVLVFWAVITSGKPADADHPWGHGKAEGLAALFQSLFILFSGLGLAIHTSQRFLSPSPAAVDFPWIAIGIIALSLLVTGWQVRRLRQVAAKTGSPALAADSEHYASDIFLNLGVIAGLALTELLGGRAWPDLLVGLAIAIWILNTAREVFLQALDSLMDRGLLPNEAAAILNTVSKFSPKVAGFHDLRTRRSGAEVFIEIHLDIDRNLSFVEAHDLSEEVGEALEAAVPRCQVTVHADPF
ncbi:MAG TPA: divalent metal cation transporter FieF [Planctomycetes bacterium]|nr:divalent metal cation transporter FieF [Planctomycetota bacterium]